MAKSRKKNEETYCIRQRFMTWEYGRTIKSIRYFFNLNTVELDVAKALRDKINALYDRDGIIYTITANNVNNGSFEPCNSTAILYGKEREKQRNNRKCSFRKLKNNKPVPFSVSTWLFFIHDKEIVL